jgi:phosphoribosylformylglycinamidine cyclo-ligase
MAEEQMTYKQAGVDISEAEKFVGMVKDRVRLAWPEASNQIGGFSGKAAVPFRTSILAASTDGVGTKLKIASLVDMLDWVGHDGAAMSLVDTYVSGALPRYMLDYLAVGKLESEKHIKIIESLIGACKFCGCRLIGGETAEMPDFFKYDWMVDLATFVIGFPDRTSGFAPLEEGQAVYGWPSRGLASNGFSLVRKVFGLNDAPSKARKKLLKECRDLSYCSLAETLLVPTPIWISPAEDAVSNDTVFSGHAHITGGGLIDNPPRALSDEFMMTIDRGSWERPPIFRLIQEKGRVPDHDMDRTFNNGIIMISIVSEKGEPLNNDYAVKIGEIRRRKKGEPQIMLTGKYAD